jgi:hypothetical protein
MGVKKLMQGMLLFTAMLALAAALLMGWVAVASGAEVEEYVLYVSEPDEGEIIRTFDEELGVYCYETDEGGISCITVCDLGCTLDCPEWPTPTPPIETPTPPIETPTPVCYQWLIHMPNGPANQLYCCDSDQCVRGHLYGGHESAGDYCVDPIVSAECR